MHYPGNNTVPHANFSAPTFQLVYVSVVPFSLINLAACVCVVCVCVCVCKI